jgi:7-cyano-7-deazaguanine reductase
VAGADEREIPLGRRTPVVDAYSPELLYPIPRAPARRDLGLGEPLPFVGVDVWYAYELSWLDPTGKPVARVGRFTVPASSPNMVESKSFKLYLNSLNNTRLDGDDAASEIIRRDVGAVVGTPVGLALFGPDDPGLGGASPHGVCLDPLPVTVPEGEPRPELLALAGGDAAEEQLYSHLLRSLCPVTGQPDWATVWLHYRGAPLDHGALLAYILSYRQHQEFHEQCVERMFRDIHEFCQPEYLAIQALYTRRGGLDISPLRSSDATAEPLPRLNRQ